MKFLLTAGFLLSFALSAQTVKVGVLAPEGTTWAKKMDEMAKDIKNATDGKVKLRFYFGGSQGDEPDVLRKIRVGQLHGGIFTGKTLGEIAGDVRVIELPFTFGQDREKALSTLGKMTPYFNKQFEAVGFQNIGFFELGMIYFVSQVKTENLDSLGGIKIWSWEGDKLVEAMISEMNLVSVPLPLPDVLSSLSTGIIQAAYAPPMGMLALQWNTKIKYIVDFPITYSVGAFLLDQKMWAKIPAKYHAKIKEISAKYVEDVNKANDKDNKDALSVMKASGIEMLKFPEADLKKGKVLREAMVKRLKGPLFSAEAYELLTKSLK